MFPCTSPVMGAFCVSPWPFDVPFIGGTLIGYDAAGYPDQPVPRLVPYHICGQL